MSYNKPELTAVSAVSAIQLQNFKIMHIVKDSLGDQFEKQTSPAYEGDE